MNPRRYIVRQGNYILLRTKLVTDIGQLDGLLLAAFVVPPVPCTVLLEDATGLQFQFSYSLPFQHWGEKPPTFSAYVISRCPISVISEWQIS
jgi:hypothetical protein